MTMLGTTILILLGIMLILYGLSIGAIFALSFSSGWWVWLVLAALCLLFAWLFHLSPEEREKLPVPRWIWVVVITTLLCFGALFLYTGAQILAAIPNDEEEDADYLIIICSSSTKLSTWVPKEIDFFLRQFESRSSEMAAYCIFYLLFNFPGTVFIGFFKNLTVWF